ncbi:MAG: hypothetical protein WBB07_26500 [Mycobacterium sp.]
MNLTRLTSAAAAGIAFAGVVGPVAAQADPLPYGPDTCVQGFVWREARPGDTVCVTPAIRDQVAQQNANPASNRDPNAGSGPLSCSQGYVWREAFDGDTICVPPAVRSATLADNAAAGSRYQRNAPIPAPAAAQQSTVRFEVTGEGTVYSIATDPPGPDVPEGTVTPFTRQMRVASDEDMFQVVAVTKSGSNGCRIVLDGKVVAEEPMGGTAHCIFTR